MTLTSRRRAFLFNPEKHFGAAEEAPVAITVEALHEVLAEATYVIPNPTVSDVQEQRFTHRDLRIMSVPELEIESDGVRMRRAVEQPANPWLVDRLERVRQEMAGRGSTG